MKTLPFLFVVAASLPLAAQQPAAAPEPSREQVESYVSELKPYIAKREERAAQIVNDILALDQAVSGSVKNVLDKLKNITDSQDSKTKVARIKRDVLERIGRAASYYASERSKLEETLRRTTNEFSREDLFKERRQFDTKIDQMVNAALEVALSMDTHQDYEQYLYEEGSDPWGWGTTIRRNPEYDQNRRTTLQTDSAKKDVSGALRQSIDRLKTKQAQLERQLADPKLTAEQKAGVQAEIDRVAGIQSERFSQLDMLAIPQPQALPEVGLKDALRLEDYIETVAADAKRDMGSLFSRYRELRAERDAIATQKAKLAHAEQWLKDHETKP